MSKYKYRICHEEKYWFELLPNNSNSQPVAKSSLYNTYGEALKGMENFRLYIAGNHNKAIDTEDILIEGNRYQLCIYFDTSHNEFIKCRVCKRYELKECERIVRENYQVIHRLELDK